MSLSTKQDLPFTSYHFNLLILQSPTFPSKTPSILQFITPPSGKEVNFRLQNLREIHCFAKGRWMWWTSQWNAAKRLVTKRGLPEPPLPHRSSWGENEPSMCRGCFPVHTLACARNTISLIFSNSAKLLFWALILARWQRLIFSQYSAIGSTPPPFPIHSLHTYNTRTGGKFKGGGVSGSQCAGIGGLSVHRLL